MLLRLLLDWDRVGPMNPTGEERRGGGGYPIYHHPPIQRKTEEHNCFEWMTGLSLVCNAAVFSLHGNTFYLVKPNWASSKKMELVLPWMG